MCGCMLSDYFTFADKLGLPLGSESMTTTAHIIIDSLSYRVNDVAILFVERLRLEISKSTRERLKRYSKHVKRIVDPCEDHTC
jgi:hypothetical protein